MQVCLNHCSAGVIYCQCGRLMTKDAAENKRYISGILDTFSIPRFYIRKNRPRGHRYGKSQGCKEYHTAHQLAKKCRKKKYDSIHDRFIRDKTFRKTIIEIGRTEQLIIEMDKLEKEDHTYTVKPAKKKLSSTVAIGGSTQMCSTLIQYLQGMNPNLKVRCQQCIA